MTLQEIKMDLDMEIGSLSGMGQLIRYFEIQSQRLDKQSLISQTAASCLNSNFESMIKFDGVPILAPAMTSNRREALKQHKKDAVLLEKKLKMRQRRQLRAEKAEMCRAQSKTNSPSHEALNRPAARHLNFDAGGPGTDTHPNPASLRQRLGATNPLSTFATADTYNTEDFGLQTLDSVNSDFMSLEEGSLPTVFSGHTLKSLKEQKISYDLDRLCKELNVQDLGSTSGSDLSDALANTQTTLSDYDVARGQKWAEKVAADRKSQEGSNQEVSFCHESQETVVEVSPEPGSDHTHPGGDDSTTSGFVDRSLSSNLEQTQTSIGSSPGCGSANTTDSQKSKVHFASFILEYNTSASQSLESTTVVKKKMSPSGVRESQEGDDGGGGQVEDVKPDHSRLKVHTALAKTSVSRKVSDEGSSNSGLLGRVSFQQDNDMSPTTPPHISANGVPFQSYGLNEGCSSDKENDGARMVRQQHQATRHATDQGNRHRAESASQGETTSVHRSNSYRNRSRKISGDSSSGYERGESSAGRLRASSMGVLDSQSTDLRPCTTAGTGTVFPQTALPPSSTVSVGASQMTISSCDSSNLVSISQVSLGLHSSGVGSVLNKEYVSDSQASSRSTGTAFTGTSGSSSSTLKEDLTPKNSINLAMNIVEGGNGHVQLQNGGEGDDIDMRSNVEENIERNSSPLRNNIQTDGKRIVPVPPHSPKRLNINVLAKEDKKDNVEDKDKRTPQKPMHIRRGSYTLSHPSPALVQARAQLEAGEEKEKFENERREKSNGSDHNQNIVSKNDENSLKKKLDFNELIRDLEESSVDKDPVVSVPSDPEKEGKAEHIDKYLRHVQFQNSMNLNSLDPEQSLDSAELFRGDDNHEDDADGNEDMSAADDQNFITVLQSIADSQSSVSKLSDLEVQSLHQRQMELARQALVEQQRKDMEELFVQQRREIMKFESEIRLAQQQSLEQHNFLVQNAPENMKVKSKSYDDEYSPENTARLNNVGNNMNNNKIHPEIPQKSLGSINSLDNMRPQSINRLSGSSYPSLNLQPKSYSSAAVPKPKTQNVGSSSRRGGNNNNHKSSETAMSDQDHHQTSMKKVPDEENFYHRQHAPHDPVDVGYNIPDFGSPSVSSPRIGRRIGMNYGDGHGGSNRHRPVSVPPQAYQPEMKAKFDRLSAVAKGFLTRCLIRSDKVQGLVKTIKDTRDFSINFQTETPIKKGNITSQDKALMERIRAQLQGALYDIHEIFFYLSPSEQMSLIEQTRVKEYVKKVKSSRDSTDVSRLSGPRMSQATMKALERKRKAREAEAIAILSTSTSSSMSRPKSGGSSNNNSPRCQNHTDGRALKPLQGQQTHHQHQTAASTRSGSSNSSIYHKEKKEKSQMAPEKQLTRPKRMAFPSSTKQSHTSGTADGDAGVNKATASTTAKTISKSKVVPVSTKNTAGKPTKSWR